MELCRLLDEADRVTERFDPPCESLRLDSWIMTALEVVRARVVVQGTRAQQMPDRKEHRVRDCDGSFVRASLLASEGLGVRRELRLRVPLNDRSPSVTIALTSMTD